MAGGEEKLEKDNGVREKKKTQRQECEEKTTKPKWKVSRNHIIVEINLRNIINPVNVKGSTFQLKLRVMK